MIRHALLILCAFPLAACSSGTDPVENPTPDAEVEVGPDTSVSTDTGADTTPDVSDDTSIDDATDAETMPSACGNAVVDPGEACDDGNVATSDGCSPACTLESKDASDVCPGTELALTLGGTSYKGHVSASTLDAYNHYAGSCGGGLGPDQVYMIKPAVTGTAFLKLAAEYDATMFVRKACDKDIEIDGSCTVVAPGKTGTTTIAVTKDEPIYVLVDSLIGGGKYTLDVEVIEAKCGDGAIQLGEQCDDGNASPGDGCGATCQLEAGGVMDDCPGMPILMKGTGDAPRILALANDTTTANDGATNTFGHGCGNYSYGDHVYAIKPDMTGSLKIETNQAYVNASFSVASECNNKAYTLWCDQTSVKGNPLDGTIPVTKDQWVYLIIDGASKGPYTAKLTLTKAACGNHALDGGEACDDGNTTDGDGCSATCTLETPSATDIAALDKCPGKDLTFPEAGKQTVTLTSSTAFPGINGDYTACGESLANDVVYHFKASVTGSVLAHLDARFAGVLALRTVCSNSTSTTDQPACVKLAADVTGISEAGYGAKDVVAPITAGKDYWLVVDGRALYTDAAALRGTFELQVTQQAAVCGNGIVDSGETCDDGDTNDNDGCSATCQIEPVIGDKCTDAIDLVLTDDGSGYKATKTVGIYSLKGDGTYPDSCGISAFGRDAYFKITAKASGLLRARVHDATFDASIGARGGACATTGPVMACVDASTGKLPEEILIPVESGKDYWVVVDMPSTETAPGRYTLDASIGPTVCGDALAGGTEECDDGNTKSGDGCDASCKLETISGADDCPGTTMTLSGTTVRYGTITLDTSKLTHQHAGKCNGSGPDGVVQITPDISGTLVARAIPTTAWSPTIYARTTCADPTTDVQTLTCSSTSYDPAKLKTTVTAGKPIWLFLDGIEAAKGVATVTVQITP
jgi:cysteine-rich repeat protein